MLIAAQPTTGTLFMILKGIGRVRDVASGPDGNIYLLLNDGSPRTGRVVVMLPEN